MTDFIPNYDDITVPEVLDQLEDLGTDELNDLYEYERDNKDRVTLLDAVEEELDSRDEELESRDSDVQNDEQVDEEPDEPADDDPDDVDDDDVEEGDDEEETEEATVHGRVRVRVPGRGSYAGHWFDEAQYATLEQTRRVQRAIDSGELEMVDDSPDL